MNPPYDMAPPKVSVVIPVYNGARYIEESVQSVLNQTLSEVEVVIVDDGSTDDTNLVLERLQKNDSRVSVITQENKGQGTARNAGLDKTRGDAVVFLDGDDYYSYNLPFDTAFVQPVYDVYQLRIGMHLRLHLDSREIYNITLVR